MVCCLVHKARNRERERERNRERERERGRERAPTYTRLKIQFLPTAYTLSKLLVTNSFCTCTCTMCTLDKDSLDIKLSKPTTLQENQVHILYCVVK